MWAVRAMYSTDFNCCLEPAGGGNSPTTLCDVAGTDEPMARKVTCWPTIVSGTTDTAVGIVVRGRSA